jgi:hypothetical protein
MKEIFSEVFLHIALFITFLMVFFFFFVVWIQKKAMIRDFVVMIKSIETDLDTGNINFSNITFNTPTTIQAQISANNQKVMNIIAMIIPTVVLGLIASAYILAPHCFWHNVVNTFFALPFIAFAEFVIVGAFMYNYIAIDTTTVEQVISNFTGQNPSGDCGYIYGVLAKILPAWMISIVGITPTTGVFS